MELFTLITGIIYIILEIRQKNLMWVVGMITSLASMWVFFRAGLYASFALNTYYLVTAFIGLWQWEKDKKEISDDVIHLNRISVSTVAISVIAGIAGVFALAWLMQMLENPMSYLDASVAVISAVATWWLVKAYLEQWWLWIAANLLSAILCATQGMWWMTALYAAYMVSAIIGYRYWKNKGRYLN